MAEPGTVRESGADRVAPWVIAGLSLFVVVAVTLVLRTAPARPPGSVVPSGLASVNALLNATSAVLLATGYLCIRRRKVTAHKACMVTAFLVSSLFLCTYLLHHAQVGSVPFAARTPWLRAVYFAVLVPHVGLSACVPPLALTTIYAAWRGRFTTHVRLARWTLPIWLYVSVSGVLVYWMLYHLPA